MAPPTTPTPAPNRRGRLIASVVATASLACGEARPRSPSPGRTSGTPAPTARSTSRVSAAAASPTRCGTAEAHAWTEGCRAFIAATYGQPSTMINQAYHTLVSNYPEFEEAAEARGYRHVNEVFTACGGTVRSEMKATLKLGRKAHWLVAAAAAASGLACAPPHGARLYSEGTWRVPSEVPTGTSRVRPAGPATPASPWTVSMHVRHGWDYSSGGRAVCVVGSDAAFVEFTVIGGMARIERLDDSTTSPATYAWPNICGSQHTQPCRTLGRGQPRRRAD